MKSSRSCKWAMRWLGLVGLSALVGLSGCTNINRTLGDVIPKREPKYKSSSSIPPLEIPPDLSAERIDADAMAIPGSAATTFSEYTTSRTQVAAASQTRGVLPNFSQVRVERGGDSERWLVVQAPPAGVWPKVRDFWLEQGFIIEFENPGIGIMETDWAEQRTQGGTGLIRGLLRGLSSALYGSATRDKFRTRLERGSDAGATEVYISHQGGEEVVSQDRTRSSTNVGTDTVRIWKDRSGDPELEAEMLNRMLVYFGVTETQARELLVDKTTRPDRAHLMRADDGASVLALQEDFSRAWRRTGLALDRVGFTVEDRDRSRGLYFVRYVDPDQDAGEEGGFLSKLKFWSDDDEQRGPSEYLIRLTKQEEITQVDVLTVEGERETSSTADRILSLLHEQLR